MSQLPYRPSTVATSNLPETNRYGNHHHIPSDVLQAVAAAAVAQVLEEREQQQQPAATSSSSSSGKRYVFSPTPTPTKLSSSSLQGEREPIELEDERAAATFAMERADAYTDDEDDEEEEGETLQDIAHHTGYTIAELRAANAPMLDRIGSEDCIPEGTTLRLPKHPPSSSSSHQRSHNSSAPPPPLLSTPAASSSSPQRPLPKGLEPTTSSTAAPAASTSPAVPFNGNSSRRVSGAAPPAEGAATVIPTNRRRTPTTSEERSRSRDEQEVEEDLDGNHLSTDPSRRGGPLHPRHPPSTSTTSAAASAAPSYRNRSVPSSTMSSQTNEVIETFESIAAATNVEVGLLREANPQLAVRFPRDDDPLPEGTRVVVPIPVLQPQGRSDEEEEEEANSRTTQESYSRTPSTTSSLEEEGGNPRPHRHHHSSRRPQHSSSSQPSRGGGGGWRRPSRPTVYETTETEEGEEDEEDGGVRGNAQRNSTNKKSQRNKGDTLQQIAYMYDMSIAALRSVNGHLDLFDATDPLPIGTPVQIPEVYATLQVRRQPSLDRPNEEQQQEEAVENGGGIGRAIRGPSPSLHPEEDEPAAEGNEKDPNKEDEAEPQANKESGVEEDESDSIDVAVSRPDTLASIAKHHRVTVDALRLWNPFLAKVPEHVPLTPGLPIVIDTSSSSSSAASRPPPSTTQPGATTTPTVPLRTPTEKGDDPSSAAQSAVPSSRNPHRSRDHDGATHPSAAKSDDDDDPTANATQSSSTTDEDEGAGGVTLADVAERFGVSVTALAAFNEETLDRLGIHDVDAPLPVNTPLRVPRAASPSQGRGGATTASPSAQLPHSDHNSVPLPSSPAPADANHRLSGDDDDKEEDDHHHHHGSAVSGGGAGRPLSLVDVAASYRVPLDVVREYNPSIANYGDLEPLPPNLALRLPLPGSLPRRSRHNPTQRAAVNIFADPSRDDGETAAGGGRHRPRLGHPDSMRSRDGEAQQGTHPDDERHHQHHDRDTRMEHDHDDDEEEEMMYPSANPHSLLLRRDGSMDSVQRLFGADSEASTLTMSPPPALPPRSNQNPHHPNSGSSTAPPLPPPPSSSRNNPWGTSAPPPAAPNWAEEENEVEDSSRSDPVPHQPQATSTHTRQPLHNNNNKNNNAALPPRPDEDSSEGDDDDDEETQLVYPNPDETIRGLAQRFATTERVLRELNPATLKSLHFLAPLPGNSLLVRVPRLPGTAVPSSTAPPAAAAPRPAAGALQPPSSSTDGAVRHSATSAPPSSSAAAVDPSSSSSSWIPYQADGQCTVADVCREFFVREDQLRQSNPFLKRYHANTVIPAGTIVQVPRKHDPNTVTYPSGSSTRTASPPSSSSPSFVEVTKSLAIRGRNTLRCMAQDLGIPVATLVRLNPHVAHLPSAAVTPGGAADCPLPASTSICVRGAPLPRADKPVAVVPKHVVQLMGKQCDNILLQRYFLLWRSFIGMFSTQKMLDDAAMREEVEALRAAVDAGKMTEADLRRRVTELRMVVDSTAVRSGLAHPSTVLPPGSGLLVPSPGIRGASPSAVTKASAAAIANRASLNASALPPRGTSPQRFRSPPPPAAIAQVGGLGWMERQSGHREDSRGVSPVRTNSSSPIRHVAAASTKPPSSSILRDAVRKGSVSPLRRTPSSSSAAVQNPSPTRARTASSVASSFASSALPPMAGGAASPRRGQPPSLGLLLHGLRVVGVTGAAQQAGIAVQDAILQVNHKLVASSAALKDAVAATQGPTVALAMQRPNGSVYRTTVPLYGGSSSSSNALPSSAAERGGVGLNRSPERRRTSSAVPLHGSPVPIAPVLKRR